MNLILIRFFVLEELTWIIYPGDVLRELDRARTSKVRVWSQSLGPIDWPLSITVGRNAPGEGIIISNPSFAATWRNGWFL